MTLILTGSPTRYGEDRFTKDNGFLATVKAELEAALQGRGAGPRVLLVSAAPDDKSFTDSVLEGMTACIVNSDIRPAQIIMLDRRNAHKAAELVHDADWIILCGGHVPTQNRFLHEIHLKELLAGFDGLVMGCSAGTAIRWWSISWRREGRTRSAYILLIWVIPFVAIRSTVMAMILATVWPCTPICSALSILLHMSGWISPPRFPIVS